MKEIEQDIKVIRESQIRMEQDIKYHIKRTDLLEQRVTKNEELFALEEDCEMPILLNKLNDNGVIYQLTEKRISFEDKDNPRNWQ